MHVTSERTEFAMGDPILVEVVYRNEGKETLEIGEPHVLRFYDCFEVRDALGAKAANPYLDVDNPSYDGPVTMHKLPPGGTVTLRKYVNECAVFEKPGEYSVAARGYRGGTPLKIRILPAPDRTARDKAVTELHELWRDPKRRELEEYARWRPYVTDANGMTDALRLLAFRRDPELLSFWIDRLGDRRRSAFVLEALAGLPDRPAVLKALEARLERGVDDRTLTAYVLLAVPGDDKDAFARRKEIRDRYERK